MVFVQFFFCLFFTVLLDVLNVLCSFHYGEVSKVFQEIHGFSDWPYYISFLLLFLLSTYLLFVLPGFVQGIKTIFQKVGSLTAFSIIGLSIFFPGSYGDNINYLVPFGIMPVMVLGVMRNVAALSFVFLVFIHPIAWLESLGERFISFIFGVSFNRLFVGAILVFGVQVSIISLGTLGGVPHVVDEIAQDWQARIFAGGKLFSTPNPAPEGQRVPFSATKDGILITQYTPGWSLFLAVGHIVQLPWAVNTFLGFLILTLLSKLAKDFFDETSGKFSLILGASSPFLILESASYMNHVSVLALFLTVLYALQKVRHLHSSGKNRGSYILWGFLTGIIVGFIPMVRPLEGLLVFFIFGGFLLFSELREKVSFLCLLSMLAGWIVSSGFHFSYNYLVSGSPFITAYEWVWEDQVHLGFGNTNPHCFHSFSHAVQNAWDNISGLGIYLLGGILPTFSILALSWTNRTSFFQKHDLGQKSFIWLASGILGVGTI
ncbi:hypothetical protein HYY75_01655, partial [bacterium]|nr:hypothetical protein [bacterium]